MIDIKNIYVQQNINKNNILNFHLLFKNIIYHFTLTFFDTHNEYIYKLHSFSSWHHGSRLFQ